MYLFLFFPFFSYKGKNGDNYLLKLVFDISGIANSDEIFDPSCPDITGHFLEALGEF